jgi:signal transduction histidine kinase
LPRLLERVIPRRASRSTETRHDRGDAASRTLGTSIVQALARQIGLDVRTVSQPGQGTSVTLRLRMGEQRRAVSDS